MADLKRARAVAAMVVRRRGAKFLPLFTRIEDEIEARQTTQSALDRAMAAAETSIY
ncbi:MAG: hypothetical protein AAF376_05085 [Pseudomonadota bacterium]